MEFAYDETTTQLMKQLTAFMEEHVYPAEEAYWAAVEAAPDVWSPPAEVLEPLKAEAKRQGLWNLFLPGKDGAGLTNLQYAPLCENLGL